MTKFDILTVGGATKDYTIYTDQGTIIATPHNLTAQKMLAFEYGAKIYSNEAYSTFGGGAANAAVALSRLGFKVSTVSRVGNDEAGHDILHQLRKEKVGTNFVQRDHQELSGFSFIIVANKKDRDRTIFNHAGCSNNLQIRDQDLGNSKPRWVYLSSLSGETWGKNLATVFRFAKKSNASVYWNPGKKQLQAGKNALDSYLRHTKILAVNKDEAIELVLSGIRLGRKDPRHLNKPLYLLNILHEWGPKVVLITDGRKGAWVYDGSKVYYRKAILSKAIDKTGVGDCYGASFLAGYINERGNITKALKWASINSASVVTKVGAQNGLLTRSALIKKL